MTRIHLIPDDSTIAPIPVPASEIVKFTSVLYSVTTDGKYSGKFLDVAKMYGTQWLNEALIDKISKHQWTFVNRNAYVVDAEGPIVSSDSPSHPLVVECVLDIDEIIPADNFSRFMFSNYPNAVNNDLRALKVWILNEALGNYRDFKYGWTFSPTIVDGYITNVVFQSNMTLGDLSTPEESK